MELVDAAQSRRAVEFRLRHHPKRGPLKTKRAGTTRVEVTVASRQQSLLPDINPHEKDRRTGSEERTGWGVILHSDIDDHARRSSKYGSSVAALCVGQPLNRHHQVGVGKVGLRNASAVGNLECQSEIKRHHHLSTKHGRRLTYDNPKPNLKIGGLFCVSRYRYVRPTPLVLE